MTLREAERRQRQHETFPRPLRVIPFLLWCKLRGISPSTGNRLQAAGKVKVTYL